MRLAELGLIVAIAVVLVFPAQRRGEGQTWQGGGAAGKSLPVPVSPPAVSSSILSAAPAAPVDINSASEAELTKVRFIGRNRAAAIIAGRPWKHTDELVAKHVIPRKYYDQIKDHLIAK